MTLKEFEKVKKAMQRINELDLEIVEIEKFAEKINQEGAKMQFDLSVNLPVKKEEVDECQIEESIAIVKELNSGCSLDVAKEIIERQNHSGMSLGLVCSMVKSFCDRGAEFSNYVRNN